MQYNDIDISTNPEEYEETKKKLFNDEHNIKYAKDPMFAPIPYGDDRQVGRTRRGIHCEIENNYDPSIVYCKCLGCNYQWQMDKMRYVTGLGDIGERPNPMVTHNVGIGGTGLIIGNFPHPKKNYEINYEGLPADFSFYYDYCSKKSNTVYIPGFGYTQNKDRPYANNRYWGRTYSKYNVLAHDTSSCKESIVQCIDGLAHTHYFYPLTGGIGEDGELSTNTIKELYFDPINNNLTGDLNSPFLGPIIPIYSPCSGDVTYNNHPGGSGTYGGGTYTDPISGNTYPTPAPREFGGYPMACPNCCRTNFIAKWLELNDRPYPYGEYEHITPGDIISDPVLESHSKYGDNEAGWHDYWYNERFLTKFEFYGNCSTHWYIQDDIFSKHVAIMPFDQNGVFISEDEIDKIYIDFKIHSCRIMFKEPKCGYFWVVKPESVLGGYIDNIDKVCTAVIVRDFQRIKQHFTEVY